MNFQGPEKLINTSSEREVEELTEQEEIKLSPAWEEWIETSSEGDKEKANQLQEMIVDDLTVEKEMKKPESPWQEYIKDLKRTPLYKEALALGAVGAPVIASLSALVGYGIYGNIEGAAITSAALTLSGTVPVWDKAAVAGIKELLFKLKGKVENRSLLSEENK